MLRQAALIAVSGTLVIVGGLAALALPAEANDAAAHALAEKFAGASEPGPPAAAEPAVPAETSTLETDAHRLAEEARKAAAEARAAALRLKADEEEMLKAARAEAEARRTPTAAAPPAPAPPSAAVEEPYEIKSVRMTPAIKPRDTKAMSPPMALGAAPPAEPAAKDSAAPTSGLLTLGVSHARQRVSVLLAMEPGDRGIRRFNKTADPVLCVGNTCYRSKGAGAAAEDMSKARALSPVTTFGARAGACRHSLSCVFRGVELPGGEALIEPVDLKVLIHDRRPAAMAKPDATCRARDGSLTCATLVSGKGWKAWIVPEAVAEKAGPTLLSAAVRTGLGTPRAVARVEAGAP